MSDLTKIIHAEIASAGAITFARFMELALYYPGLGYYETGRNRVGFKGDFYTSVSTGELFGQLLAFRFACWLETLPADGERWIIEAGAHDGKLAHDILAWLRQHRPDLFGKIRYGILEPSADRQQWQREKLGEFGERVRWFERMDFSPGGENVGWPSPRPSPPGEGELSAAGLACSKSAVAGSLAKKSAALCRGASTRENGKLNGIIFSNELLDAMPLHRLGWGAKSRQWFEWGVTLEGDHFTWTKLAPAAADRGWAIGWPEELLDVLPDGYTIETCPAAEKWWHDAAGILKQGWLLTLDYGFTAEEMISPSRTKGTVRAYARHQVSDDLLANPGEQDLTAHVNFSAIQAAGERAGLNTDGYLTQPQFLTKILGEAIKDRAFADWNPSRTRQFQTLTHPQHLGRAFKVLVQEREKRAAPMAPEREGLEARLRLKRAREAAGKCHEELAKFAGNSTPAYHDLEDGNDDLYTCIDLGDLGALCSELEIKPPDLFDDGTITGPQISREELIGMAQAHLRENNLNVSDFEERIGFEIEASLIDPNKVLGWNVDFLRWLCHELKIDWRRALP